MQDAELKEIWKAYDQKWEESKVLNMQSWALNIMSVEMIQQHRAKSKLNKLITIKAWTALLGIAWVGVLTFFVYHTLVAAKPFFIVSASVIAVITLWAVIVYIKHIVLIRQIDNTESVVDVQKRITVLQSSTIQITRILFLQAPFYTTWFLSVDDMLNGSSGFWFISVPIAILFTLATIWLYRNIDLRNKDKKWFKLLFSGAEWTYLAKAAAFLEEIDTFKKNI
jgi:hypothetical protein